MQIRAPIDLECLVSPIFQKQTIHTLVCSERENHFDDLTFNRTAFHPRVPTITFHKNIPAALQNDERFDLAIILTHWVEEVEHLKLARLHQLAKVYVLWLWDNHIAEDFHHALATLADIVFVAHGFNTHYLLNDYSILYGHIPLCSVQWDADTAEAVMRESGFQARSNALYGAFFTYKEFPERHEFLTACATSAIPNEIRLRFASEENRSDYFESNKYERLRDWMQHKTSLCLPLHNDLSSRFFDALLAGQIPIAPRNIPDLDTVLPPEVQDWLPVIRFDNYTVDDVSIAYNEAIARFDADGPIGVLRRHKFVKENHLARNRFINLFDQLL